MARKTKHQRSTFRPVKRPGAATRAAKREGVPLSEWSREHYHDPGVRGKEARFIKIRKEWRSAGGKRKKTRTSHRSSKRG